MSLFTPGRSILGSVALQASESIEYRTASGVSVWVNARIGQRLMHTAQGQVPVVVSCRRFIVNRDDLPAVPCVGDTVFYAGRRWKLGHPDGGPPWRPHTPDGRVLAIFATDFGPV